MTIREAKIPTKFTTRKTRFRTSVRPRYLKQASSRYISLSAGAQSTVDAGSRQISSRLATIDIIALMKLSHAIGARRAARSSQHSSALSALYNSSQQQRNARSQSHVPSAAPGVAGDYESRRGSACRGTHFILIYSGLMRAAPTDSF